MPRQRCFAKSNANVKIFVRQLSFGDFFLAHKNNFIFFTAPLPEDGSSTFPQIISLFAFTFHRHFLIFIVVSTLTLTPSLTMTYSFPRVSSPSIKKITSYGIGCYLLLLSGAKSFDFLQKSCSFLSTRVKIHLIPL